MTNARGTIVAEPEPIDLDWAATALVIIDMQRDFMEPGDFTAMAAPRREL